MGFELISPICNYIWDKQYNQSEKERILLTKLGLIKKEDKFRNTMFH